MMAEESVYNRSDLVSIHLQFTYNLHIMYCSVIHQFIIHRISLCPICNQPFSTVDGYYKQFCFFKIRQFLSTIYACRMFGRI